jgi:hypothetical protein
MDILGQQVFEILLGLNQGRFFKNMSQVTVGLQRIGLGGLDQSEKGGTSCGHRLSQPVNSQFFLLCGIPAHHKGADSIFDQVVIHI